LPIQQFDIGQCSISLENDSFFNMNAGIPMKIYILLVLGVAVSAAALCFSIPVSWASEHGPWCAVLSAGNGDVTWDCQYNSKRH
jgi:hypothetical protein